MDRPCAQVLDECMEVISDHRVVMRHPGHVGIPKAPHIDCIDAVGLGQNWDQLMKCPPAFGSSVNEQDRRATLTGLYVAQVCAIEGNAMVRNFRNCHANG